jgi:hypothetical protein
LEEDVKKTDFAHWLTSRFKQSLTILTIVSLKAAIESPYDTSTSGMDLAAFGSHDQDDANENVAKPSNEKTEDEKLLEEYEQMGEDDGLDDLGFLN